MITTTLYAVYSYSRVLEEQNTSVRYRQQMLNASGIENSTNHLQQLVFTNARLVGWNQK
jgi:hypothetical protein